MDRRLRRKHISVILKKEIINILDLLHIKDFLRRKVESTNPVFNESVDIDSFKKSIVVFPNMPWGYRKQRPQHIFSRLAKKNFNIFYISPITSDREYISNIEKNIYEIHLKTTTSGNVLRNFHLNIENREVLIASFNNLLKKYLKKDTYIFVEHPVWKDVVFELGEYKIVYDLMDLYSGFPEARAELIEAEEQLISKSNIVLTTADNLYEYAKGLNKNVHMIKNGCDFDYFNNIIKNGLLEGLSDKPVIGYFGAINSWFDVESLEYVVKKNMDKYFVFIGSINTNSVRRLYKYKNVFFLGEIEYGDLGGYLSYFDVCLIPFVLNDLIKNTNPVKFYEYISSGKPVVSVRLPELEEYSDICYLYNTKEEFNDCIQKALIEDKSIEEKRIDIAKKNSWDSRVEDIIKLII
jgi:hypothetical protein